MSAIPVDALEAIAWRDCLVWASSDGDVLQMFLDETGMKLPTSGLDRMIDEATGNDKRIAEKFVEWFNENIWGREDRTVE